MTFKNLLDKCRKVELSLLIFVLALFGSCSSDSNSKVDEVKVKQIEKLDTLFVDYDSISIKEHVYSDLSYLYDYKVKFVRMYNFKNIGDSSIVQVFIFDKKTKKKLDNIEIRSIYYFGEVFESRNNVKSFITGKNKGKESIDNNFGDLIVADFNFDSKEDFAVINDSGGNNGPLYTFYLQNEKGRFSKDQFLTDTVIFFPSKINLKNKSLTTRVHADICGFNETVYQFNSKSNRWKRKNMRYVDVCN